MSELPYITPFDILVKSFFNSEGTFEPIKSSKLNHPVDIYEDSNGLTLEVACTGLTKDDVEVLIEGHLIKIKHDRSKKDQDVVDMVWYSNGISKRSFNLGFKIATRFDVNKTSAKFENGLLIVNIPLAESSKPKLLKIN